MPSFIMFLNCSFWQKDLVAKNSSVFRLSPVTVNLFFLPAMSTAEHINVRNTAAYSVEVICKITNHCILLGEVAFGRREFVYSCVWFILFF